MQTIRSPKHESALLDQALVIGDVHGCVAELEILIDTYGKGRQIIFVGDLVAKGPSSIECISLAMQHQAMMVLGNHDARVLRFADEGKTDAYAEPSHHKRIAYELSQKMRDYLRNAPLSLKLTKQNVRVIHAGLVPGTELEKQNDDTFYTLRSLSSQGPTKKLLPYPWASRYKGPEHIVFGHDAIRGIQRYPFATGLDSGCVYGGKLSALLLPEHRLVSVKAKESYHAIQ